MKKIKNSLFSLLLILLCNCKKTSNIDHDSIITIQHTNSSGYTYETVSNDPTGLRLYTLDNGLKIYLGKNQEEPKIQTLIAIKAGYKYDPIDNTGLAHYLEHMLFKGTDKIGSLNFEKENILLNEIADLFEKHKVEKDTFKKKEIYKIIDKKSLEASKYAVANEYDKMIALLGAEENNAFTEKEQTVYQNKIPANELDKWLLLQSERFNKLVLRGFHTELEAVYEEFNRGQDNDQWKQYDALLEGLYPSHPYGYQFGIGKPEHLKNPSMHAVHSYFDKYYVPNNMAIILVGDIDYDATIKKVDNAFGNFEKKEVVFPKFKEIDSISSPVKKKVFGPSAESIYVGFRTEGIGSKQEVLVTLIDYMLTNSQAGILDLNLNQKQLVQNAFSTTNFANDYGYHLLVGLPKENQTLEEVRNLLLSQIEKIKKGEFNDWLLKAVVNDLKLAQLRKYENTTSTANDYLQAYIASQNWEDRLKILEIMSSITKQEVINFANTLYKNNYVEVYKIKGNDKNIVKVESPKITPIELNREKESNFIKNFSKISNTPLLPEYLDYKTAIQRTKTNKGLKFEHINNPVNDIFNLDIIFDMGKDNDQQLSLASDYIKYLGTDKYTPEQLKQEFYKLGITYNLYVDSDKTYANIQGLIENFDAGLELFEHFWNNMSPNSETYENYIHQIQKDRQNSKTEKSNILFGGLWNYAHYGEKSSFRNIYSLSELQKIKPQKLIDKVKELRNFKQRIFYYGKNYKAAITSIDKHHKTTNELQNYPDKIEFKEREEGGKVYFVDYDMVQSEIVFLAKGKEFDPKKTAAIRLFNAYFGSGVSSIVFQEIRESKALAYSVEAGVYESNEKKKSNLVYAYLGTQANKMSQAIDAMGKLMEDMPEAEEQFNQAKEAALKQIAAERITKSNIFWTYESLKKKGIDKDNRKEMYDRIKNMTLTDLKNFFNENIKGEDYNILVIGNKKEMDIEALSKLGNFEEMDIDYLFNHEKNKKDIKL
ncbi:M16 family metallopeptidase [uncultured Aquimarina sp.]|uniref:M16 family metallopeptidase n=1 Tax=uncultured Aquimarina sp. TaxID=575652 RepID=UPI00261AEC9C|nr:M16 family metallopeptidase [uncultured Aquimarina sp.]